MSLPKSRFALFFANRGFFPASHQRTARKEMQEVLTSLGHDLLVMEAEATRHGAVETPAEGRKFKNFLDHHKGEIDGIIVCLPNFGDETGAVSALDGCDLPILVHAYPDRLDEMAPSKRRDAFCGKLSIMDVFFQYGIRFTALPPHTVAPGSPEFASAIQYFDRTCRVVRGLRSLVVGAVGARTTAFKTVRVDELALQKHGVTVETYDLSAIINWTQSLSDSDPRVRDKSHYLSGYTDWSGAPDAALTNLSKLGVVLEELIESEGLDALSLRCWVELQQQLHISPCTIVSELGNRSIPVACEVDTGNAVMMHALGCAAGSPSTLLDWNNNYGSDQDKCILFHCGPVPQSLMADNGRISDHEILKNELGPGRAYGCIVGRIRPMPFTYGSLMTVDGKIKTYLGTGRITEDEIPTSFFGCAGVAQVDELQNKLQRIGYGGFRHHVAIAPDHVAAPTAEALEKYLGYEVLSLD